MKFYHGTTKEKWLMIKDEGVLWGKHSYRYTYLTPDLEMAEKYGDIVLEVDYNPVGVGNLLNGKTIDNYGFNPPLGQYCWQFSVFIPIPIDKCKVIKGENNE